MIEILRTMLRRRPFPSPHMSRNESVLNKQIRYAIHESYQKQSRLTEPSIVPGIDSQALAQGLVLL